ncbi:hypothetical protein DFH06DRAFT_924397, partial [Mycena polygramma]
VVHAFTPFTTAEVFTVLTPADTPPHLPFPPSSLIIAKVYDPKVHFRRHKSVGSQWTLAAETSAVFARTAPFNPSFRSTELPEEGDLVGWEEYYHQICEYTFRDESSAYDRLAPLQGTAIPRCFGVGTRSLVAEQRVLSPRVLLLEYIPDAISLRDIDPSVIPADSKLELGNFLIKTAHRFAEFGVVHTDVNPGNILFTPVACPTRAVIIDFGESGVRRDEDN